MNLFVAIDGGGTKTDLVLFEESGRVLCRVRAPGSNPNDIGIDGAQTVLAEGLRSLLQPYGGLAAELRGAFAGLSGGTVGSNRPRMQAVLRALLPNAAVTDSHSDAISALSSGAPNDGCVVIAGTGSVGFARKGAALLRVGGWGDRFDKGGSGYDFGRDVLYHVLCAFDGRGPATCLSRLVEQALGMSAQDAVPKLYEGGKAAVAALAPLAFEALRQKDVVARKIVRENARELAKLLNALSGYVDETPCATVLAGSVFRDFAYLEPYVVPLLLRTHRFMVPALPPVYGSAVEALRLAGLGVNDAFESQFARTLRVVTTQSGSL